MSWIQRLVNSGGRRARIERELTDEVLLHQSQHAADLEEAGWSPEAARREAQRRLCLPGTWIAEGVAQDTLPWVSTALRESRQALRSLGRRPVFLATVTSTLSVGAGVLLAACAIAATVLASLPYPAPSRLVVLEESIDGEGLGGNPARTADWQRFLTSVRGVAGLSVSSRCCAGAARRNESSPCVASDRSRSSSGCGRSSAADSVKPNSATASRS